MFHVVCSITDLAKPDSQRASERDDDDDEVVLLPEHVVGELLVHHSVHGGEVPDAVEAVAELASVPPISPFNLLFTLLSLLRLLLLNTFHHNT